MSRIGKLPVKIGKDVKVALDGDSLNVSGKNGALSLVVHESVSVESKGDELIVTPKTDEKISQSMWGTTRTLISNMVQGVSVGFVRDLEFNGVGYKASVSGSTLNLQFGIFTPHRI